jgi:hypothetical protein
MTISISIVELEKEMQMKARETNAAEDFHNR